MSTLSDDIRFVTDDEYRNCVSSILDLDKFDFIYSRTNEDICELFRTVDVRDQDVFTVLSSSDYLFSIVEGSAKSVDTFDVNPLTYRYYHLRKWLLQEGRIDAEGLSIDAILEIVGKYFSTLSKEERESAIFWTKYLSGVDCKSLYEDNMFAHIHVRSQNMPYSQDVSGVVKKLSDMQIGFQKINICRSVVEPDKKYDTIFLSNILDYNRKSADKLNVAVSNLYGLLNSGGKVVLSHFHGRLYDPDMDMERDAFSSCFDYNALIECNVNRYRSVSYYQYIKKK